MRVLDIGCGSGEITRAVADLVGPNGTVVGFDSNAQALAMAASATEANRPNNIEYVLGDLSKLDFRSGAFDCIVGRRVLVYVREPKNVIGRLVDLLRHGGRMAFQESDATMTPGRIGSWPLHDQVHRWMWETVRREGGNPHLGMSLAPMLRDAGLAIDALWAQAIFAGYEHGLHHPLHSIVGFIQSRIIELGAATASEIDLPTLAQRLEAERMAQDGTYVSDMAICVVAVRGAKPEGAS